MALENATTIITDIVNGNNGSNDYVWIFLVLGGIVGTFMGVMLPYYRKKREFGKEGIDLIFDKDFLKTGAGALIISIIAIGAIYPTLLANTDPAASYGSAFIAAATLAFTLNVGGNWIIGTQNRVAEQQLISKKAEQLVALKAVQQQEQPAAAVSTVNTGNVQTTGGTIIGGENVTQPGSSGNDPI